MTITQINEKYGAFYAFGKEQFEDQKVEGVEYYGTGYGLYIPKRNYDDYVLDLNSNQC